MKNFTQKDVEKVAFALEMIVISGILPKEKTKSMLACLMKEAGNLKFLKHNFPDDNLPKLMKRKEVANYLGISTVQVDRLAKQGFLKKIIIGTNTTRYSQKDVIKFVTDKTSNDLKKSFLKHREELNKRIHK